MRTWIRIAAIAVVLLPARAFAWGQDGHKATCAIAFQRLTPAAHTMLAKLLGADDENTFADACIWADQVRREYPQTSAYHYINIPAGTSGFSWTRDCADPAKRCAPWAIEHYTAILMDPNAKEDDRRDALRFVSHFVGDLHQPLHAGRPEDEGGNTIKVDWFGNTGNGQYSMNLHSVWDSQIIRHTNQQWPAIAHFLNAQVTDADAAQWQNFDVVSWANDSYRIDEEFVYPHVPADGKLASDYFAPAAGYVALQLERGGVRLAYLLNAIAAGNVKFPSMAS